MILKKIKVVTPQENLLTNTYIVCDEKTKEAMVIDPGGEPEKIIEMFNINELETKDPTYLSNSRSISILKRCLKRVEDIAKSLNDNMPIAMIELDIKNIWEELGTINGTNYEEELLDEMFSRFCLGK